MTASEAAGRAVARWGWLGLILFVVVAAPMYFTSRWDDDEKVPRSSRDAAYLLVDGRRYLATDRSGDGRVDCLVPVGVRALAGVGVLAAGGARGCGRPWSTGRMDAPLQDSLTELLAKKYALDACHTSCIDLDSDHVVDCVVSVHNPRVVLLAAAGAACPAPARAHLSDEERRQYSEILALEDAVRGQILAVR